MKKAIGTLWTGFRDGMDALPMRIWRWLRYGLPRRGRGVRYLAACLLGLFVIWGLVGAYLNVAPPRYRSGFTLILPGAGARASVNLDSIGQASSNADSAYATSKISPTESYKRLLTTGRVLEWAAQAIDREPAHFPGPSIKLIDQTNLIQVEVSQGGAESAEKAAWALLNAFQDELDRLRQEEIAQRDLAYRRVIAQYKDGVAQTRRGITGLQAESGLISLDQFAGIVDEMENLKRRIAEIEAAWRLKAEEVESLAATMTVSPELAAAALRLKSDRIFQDLFQLYTAKNAELGAQSGVLGERHPVLQQLRQESENLLQTALAHGQRRTGLSFAVLRAAADLSVKEEQAKLFAALVEAVSQRDGLAAKADSLKAQLAQQEARVETLVPEAARLDDLERDHQVAEAVFSSALARIDTSRADLFASYPMAQVLESPARPLKPSSPSFTIGMAAGVFASLLLITGLMLAWLRQRVFNKLLPAKPETPAPAAPLAVVQSRPAPTAEDWWDSAALHLAAPAAPAQPSRASGWVPPQGWDEAA